MNNSTILQADPQDKASTTDYPRELSPQKESEIILPDRSDRAVMSENNFHQAVKGGAGQLTDMNTGRPLPDGGGLPNSRESMQVNTEARVSSIQECALSDTLKAVRGLRDEYFLNEADSRPGLLLAQVAFILERIEHGIPSGRETFLAVVRAARLPEPTTEAAEVTV